MGETMRRVVVLTLIASLGNVPFAFAGENLRSVAARVVRQAVSPPPAAAPRSAVMTTAQRSWALAQEQPAVATSGLKKRTKVMILLGAAVGVVATMYAIDHRVEDNTPSSLGIRED
jgi:hypothetical protein